MEQDLIQYIHTEKGQFSYFKPEYKDQNVKDLPKFIIWYENINKYIKKENKNRTNKFRNNHDFLNEEIKILLISFCPNCSCYTICKYEGGFSFINCSICESRFCCGCLRGTIYDGDGSTCLKGFFKTMYLRVIYNRTSLYEVNYLFYLMHILIFIFFTPLFALFNSFYLGHLYHPNIKHTFNNKDDILSIVLERKWYYREENKRFYGTICGAIFGFLMFPYIITFLPFMTILFLPSIFSPSYYKKIYLIYNTIMCPGVSVLE